MTEAATHSPPAIHFFVKIASFELLYVLKFEADIYETSHYCKIHSGESTFSFPLKILAILKRDAICKC